MSFTSANGILTGLNGGRFILYLAIFPNFCKYKRLELWERELRSKAVVTIGKDSTNDPIPSN
jgi:hypothetical protein